MDRRRGTRLGALAAGLSLAVIVPFAHFAQAESVPTLDNQVVPDGPVGVVLLGSGPDMPPVADDSPPATDPTPTDPSPSNKPADAPATAGGSTSLAAAPMGITTLRPPRRMVTPDSAVGGLPRAAGLAQPAAKGEGVSLEDIFLTNGTTVAGPAAPAAEIGRSSIPVAVASSMASMLMACLMAMLGMLLVAGRKFGMSLHVTPILGRTFHHRSAPRGWKIVVTSPVAAPAPAPAPAPAHASARMIVPSALERPVLAPLQPAALSAR